MPPIQLEISDETIDALADAIASRLGNEDSAADSKKKPAAKKKAASKKEEPEEESNEITKEEFLALCEEASEESSKKEVTAVLGEFDYKTPKKVKAEDYEEIAVELGKLIEEEEEDDDDNDSEEEITINDVKEAFTSAKKVDADEAKEALTEYGIKSVKSLKKLNDEDLGELYDDLMDIAEDDD